MLPNGFPFRREGNANVARIGKGTMSNLFRSWNNWFSVSSQTAMLALEAQSVIALRLMRIAAGGALARSETTRMVTEKVQALGEAQAIAAVGSVTGRNRRHIAKKVAGVYRKRVLGNRRRLTR
jgi:hypothetical protein